MNLQNTGRLHAKRGFTLLELLLVVAIIMVLATITFGGFHYVTIKAHRNATAAKLAFISASLDNYFLDFNEYPPVVKDPLATTTVNGVSFQYASSAALYQAISGDGNDFILALGTPSDGEFTAEEVRRGITELETSYYHTLMAGVFSMVDGFHQPFMYVRSDPANPAGTRNPTFDLWSVAESESPGQTSDAGTADNPTWIKNW